MFKLEYHLFGGFYEEIKTLNANKIINELIKKYGEPECGRNRATFKLKNHVFKFPKNDAGETDNDWEGNVKNACYAVSRRVMYKGFICVMAEIIDVNVPYKELPFWAQCTDGAGRCKKGNIKVYDFGIR